MTPNLAFTFDVLFLAIGLCSIAYIVYGRVKRKPIIGDYYMPGSPGYNTFLKIVSNNFYLVLAVIATMLSAAILVFDALRVLELPASSHSIFIIGPAMVVIGLIIVVKVMSILYKSR